MSYGIGMSFVKEILSKNIVKMTRGLCNVYIGLLTKRRCKHVWNVSLNHWNSCNFGQHHYFISFYFVRQSESRISIKFRQTFNKLFNA